MARSGGRDLQIRESTETKISAFLSRYMLNAGPTSLRMGVKMLSPTLLELGHGGTAVHV